MIKNGDLKGNTPVQHVLCHVVRATSRGRGAVATLFLTGVDPLQVIAPLLEFPGHAIGNRSISDLLTPSETHHFAKLRLGTSCEEIVLYVRDRHFLELHCHGGEIVLHAIENTLAENGAVPQSWEQWLDETQNTYPGNSNQRLDAIQRDALRLLPYAETDLTARLLLAQYHGALSRQIQRLVDLLDGISFDSKTDSKRNEKTVEKALQLIESLLETYKIGKHLTVPMQIAVIGPVNVGKSTLVNALLGFERAITSPVPGTTRDPVSAKTVLRGWPVVLIDTAGTRETSDPIEREGIARTHVTAAQADLVLNVIDASVSSANQLSPDDFLQENAPRINVFNKIDLVTTNNPTCFQKLPNSPIFLSSKNGQGLDRLVDAILDKMSNTGRILSHGDSFLVFSEQQYQQLSQIKDTLQHGKYPNVLLFLSRLLISGKFAERE